MSIPHRPAREERVPPPPIPLKLTSPAGSLGAWLCIGIRAVRCAARAGTSLLSRTSDNS